MTFSSIVSFLTSHRWFSYCLFLLVILGVTLPFEILYFQSATQTASSAIPPAAMIIAWTLFYLILSILLLWFWTHIQIIVLCALGMATAYCIQWAAYCNIVTAAQLSILTLLFISYLFISILYLTILHRPTSFLYYLPLYMIVTCLVWAIAIYAWYDSASGNTINPIKGHTAEFEQLYGNLLSDHVLSISHGRLSSVASLQSDHLVIADNKLEGCSDVSSQSFTSEGIVLTPLGQPLQNTSLVYTTWVTMTGVEEQIDARWNSVIDVTGNDNTQLFILTVNAPFVPSSSNQMTAHNHGTGRLEFVLTWEGREYGGYPLRFVLDPGHAARLFFVSSTATYFSVMNDGFPVVALSEQTTFTDSVMQIRAGVLNHAYLVESTILTDGTSSLRGGQLSIQSIQFPSATIQNVMKGVITSIDFSVLNLPSQGCVQTVYELIPIDQAPLMTTSLTRTAQGADPFGVLTEFSTLEFNGNFSMEQSSCNLGSSMVTSGGNYTILYELIV